MKKVIVIGCPGSGKSTFSKALHQATGIALFHLDLLFWNKDKTTVDQSVFLERLTNIFQNNAWIIDGNYASSMELRMQECDTVIFLDYPLEICLEGIRMRQGKPRSDMPWIEAEEFDEEFLSFIKNYNTQSRPLVMELLARYPDKDIHIFTDRTQAEEFLSNLQ